MVPIIGAVSSPIGAAANIISSVSAAGVEIIEVGEERYVSKHNVPEPAVQMVEIMYLMVPAFLLRVVEAEPMDAGRLMVEEDVNFFWFGVRSPFVIGDAIVEYLPIPRLGMFA